MSNFQFLHKEWPLIYEIARDAEVALHTKPLTCSMYCRQALEKGMYWMFGNDDRLEIPTKDTLGFLIGSRSLKPLMTKSQRRNLQLLQILGNAAIHRRELKSDEKDMLERFSPISDISTDSDKDLAYVALCLLFEYCSYLAVSYSKDNIEIPVFNEGLITNEVEFEQLTSQIKKDRSDESIKRRQLPIREETKTESELETRRAELTQLAESRATIAKSIPQIITEAKTRELYINFSLKESGWNKLVMEREIEFEVIGMPLSTNPSGIGYVDYVLWGDDGKPLAVIEAKKTTANVKKGKHQASLYADCLEKMTGQRPIIFYTNGFEIFIWDDLFYPEREISGFYTKDELQLLIDRRITRKDPRIFKVDRNIAGRTYQLEAIRRVAENLCHTSDSKLVGKNRKSLLVMATGSGKTRTAAAIVDMLTKTNWAKRILFLADRNALVTQAKNAFKEHLEHLSAIDLTKEKEDNSTRLVFSTYPTIINKIDKLRKGDKRFYGVGHFDLIILDEAHRSIYHKYKSIFEYFDSMLLGLTATPKKDIDRNTYSLFEIEDDDPTFAYELEEAVSQGFLVPPKSISVPLKFQREGIKYKELSEKEKEEYEEKFGDPTVEEVPDTIESGAVNKWLFNTDTVDKVLEYLMINGIKVNGGDKLGKTIIFAKNHQHAVFIEDRFNKNYPEYSGKFLRVIDNYESKAQDLLEKFTDPYEEQDPQIAVSVDMMDTGVDAPRVVNLVFFKMVKSSSKFWQMIGRGTRLCPDLFEPGKDKKEFIIFDYCQNFEFFDEFPEGTSTKPAKPLMQQIFEARLNIIQLISSLPDKSPEEQIIRDSYLNTLHKTIESLDQARFVVRKQLRYVNKYSIKDSWLNLSKSNVLEINTHLSHLEPATKDDDELARRFDMIILNYQILLLKQSDNSSRYRNKISNIARSLQKKSNIPQVSDHISLIKEVQTDAYWENINLNKLELIRLAFRDLVKYLDTQKQSPVYTNFKDDLDLDGVVIKDVNSQYGDLVSYRRRVESYIEKNKNHLTISKLRNNIPITAEEIQALETMLFTDSIAGTKEQFTQLFGEQPLGAFIRSITGVNQIALNEAFADFLHVGNLRADQITFINTVISYLSKNGTIDKAMLYKPPFTDLNDQGINGIFDEEAEIVRIIKIIDQINNNAISS